MAGRQVAWRAWTCPRGLPTALATFGEGSADLRALLPVGRRPAAFYERFSWRSARKIKQERVCQFCVS
jgi:hypothetical protein